jgi:hypothetical protein
MPTENSVEFPSFLIVYRLSTVEVKSQVLNANKKLRPFLLRILGYWSYVHELLLHVHD